MDRLGTNLSLNSFANSSSTRCLSKTSTFEAGSLAAADLHESQQDSMDRQNRSASLMAKHIYYIYVLPKRVRDQQACLRRLGCQEQCDTNTDTKKDSCIARSALCLTLCDIRAFRCYVRPPAYAQRQPARPWLDARVQCMCMLHCSWTS